MLLVTALSVLACAIWCAFDHGLPDWDASSHILCSIQYTDLLSHPRPWKLDWIHAFLSVNSFYPPAVYVFNGFLKLAFGVVPGVEVLSRSIYVAISSVSLYFITYGLLKDRLAGALSVVLFHLYPQNSVLMHASMLDFPLAAMVALGLWLLIRWQQQPTWGNTVLLSLAMAAACLTKQLAAAFLVPAGVLALGQELVGRSYGRAGRLVLCGALTAAIGLPWLLVNIEGIRGLAHYNQAHIGQKDLLPTLLSNVGFYLSAFPNMLSPLLCLAFVFAAATSTARVHRILMLLAVSSLGGMILISTLTWAFPLTRYFMAGLTMPAAYTASKLAELLKGRNVVLKALAVAVLTLGLLQFVAFNYSPYPVSGPKWLLDMPHTLSVALREFRGSKTPTAPCRPGDWGQFWTISTISKMDSVPVWLNVLPSSQEINVHTLEYVAHLLKSEVRPTTCRTWTVMGDTTTFSAEKAMYYQWYLLKTGFQGNAFADKKASEEYRKYEDFVRSSGKFVLVGEKMLPDGSILSLYRQR